MNKELISGRQLIFLVFTILLSTATLSTPAIVTLNAGRDGWISMFLSGGVGLITVWVITSLGLQYPNQNPLEYSERILGKWLGKLISMIFIFFYLHLTAIIVAEVTDVITYNLMVNSSVDVINFFLMVTCAYAVKKGLEVLTRANILIVFSALVGMTLYIILIIKDLQPSLLTPILGNGIKPILNGMITPVGAYAEVVIIAFIMPFLNQKKEARASAIIGVVWILCTLTVLVAITIAVFGDKLVSDINYPILKSIRIINIADYVQNIEEVFLIPWLLLNVMKICIFYNVTVLMISQFFKLDEGKTMVIPVGMLISSVSLALFHHHFEIIEFFMSSWGIYALSIQLGIPMLLLGVSKLRSV